MRTFQRKILDELQEKYKSYYHGVVLDIGGRDRGKFQKPKEKVEKWIFADIVSAHHPDIVLDVADMKQIKTESIDVVNTMELFEHVEEIDKGLDECVRVLKPNGTFVISIPFLCPVHGDPFDFQRWTKTKWENELRKRKLKIEHFEIIGGFFSILADMGLKFTRDLPQLTRKPTQVLLFPFLLICAYIDRKKTKKESAKLNGFHMGYFIIAKKQK